MKIFSKHRKKLEPKRRFGGREFRNKVKTAQNYKRMFAVGTPSAFSRFMKKIGRGWMIWVYGTVLIILVIGYYLIFSPTFVVSHIEVSGNVQVTTQQIQDAILSEGNSRVMLVKKDNYFLLNQSRVNQILTNKLPTIKEVTSFKSVWPNRIVISVSEHVPAFVIESNGINFLIDEEGTVVSQIDDPKDYLVVHDELIENFATGEVLENSKLAAFVISMMKQWDGKISTPIASVKFQGKSSTDVQFVSQEGWNVFFDTTRPVIAQLNNLTVLLSKVITPKDQPSLAYIDLRIAKWAYYCLKDKPCAQTPQPDTVTPDTAGATTTTATPPVPAPATGIKPK